VGDAIKATEVRIRNSGTAAVPAELKLWLTVPGVTPVTILSLGSDGGLVLPAGADNSLGLVTLFSATGLPTGNYEFSSRILDPTTGRLLSEDLNPFFVAAATQVILPKTAVEPAPVLEMTLSKSSYVNGETVTAAAVRLKNPASLSSMIELKIWLGIPGTRPLPMLDMGSDQSFGLPPNFDQSLGPVSFFTVISTLPRGTYEISSRMVHPATGKLLSEDRNTFEIR
jgi:hypothetical protein